MDVSPPPPQDDNPIITQFRPVEDQWELTDDNINRIDPKTGHTILYNYCKYINTTPLEVYQYLIETKGCDVNVQDKNNDTPLHYALGCFNPHYGGSITVLMYLLGQMSVNANIKGQCGYTLLHTACQQINSLPLEIFKLLIETMGCDVNAQDEYNNTPLHNAFLCFNLRNSGAIAALTYLINQTNIDVNIKDKNGHTILHLACICEIGYDDEDDHDDDDEDDYSSDEGLGDSVKGDIKNQKAAANLCQIVEVIVERCIEEVLDETTTS
jgi:hypothetical protein